jgi:hypothetical protein
MKTYDLDIVIPVLMPSVYLKQMRNHLANLNSSIRVNYILDFMYCKITRDNSIHDLRQNERIFTGKFGSPGVARNSALKKCDSEFICFWDIDDFPDTETINVVLNKLRDSNKDMAIGEWSFFGQPLKKQGTSVIKVGSSPGIWRFVFKKELLKGVEFSNLNWGEDQLFLMGVFANKPRILTIDKIIYRYREDTPGSLTSQKKHVFDLYEVLKRGIEYFIVSKGNYKKCCGVMLLKQVFTLYRYGGFILGLKALMYLILKTHASIFNPMVFARRSISGMEW